MSDENILIIKAQDGDGEAESELIRAYTPFVKAIARSYFANGVDGDEIVQAGLIGLMNAIRSYNVEDGSASFKTYASTCIHNRIRTALRKQSAASKNTPLTEILDLPSEINVEDSYEEIEAEQQLMSEISSVLNECEMDVLNLYLSAMSYQEISDRLGIEKKKVDNTIYSCKKKIKKLLDKKK